MAATVLSSFDGGLARGADVHDTAVRMRTRGAASTSSSDGDSAVICTKCGGGNCQSGLPRCTQCLSCDVCMVQINTDLPSKPDLLCSRCFCSNCQRPFRRFGLTYVKGIPPATCSCPPLSRSSSTFSLNSNVDRERLQRAEEEAAAARREAKLLRMRSSQELDMTRSLLEDSQRRNAETLEAERKRAWEQVQTALREAEAAKRKAEQDAAEARLEAQRRQVEHEAMLVKAEAEAMKRRAAEEAEMSRLRAELSRLKVESESASAEHELQSSRAREDARQARRLAEEAEQDRQKWTAELEAVRSETKAAREEAARVRSSLQEDRARLLRELDEMKAKALAETEAAKAEAAQARKDADEAKAEAAAARREAEEMRKEAEELLQKSREDADAARRSTESVWKKTVEAAKLARERAEQEAAEAAEKERQRRLEQEELARKEQERLREEEERVKREAEELRKLAHEDAEEARREAERLRAETERRKQEEAEALARKQSEEAAAERRRRMEEEMKLQDMIERNKKDETKRKPNKTLRIKKASSMAGSFGFTITGGDDVDGNQPWVDTIDPYGAAAESGLQIGDHIISINGQSYKHALQGKVRSALRAAEKAGQVALAVWRDFGTHVTPDAVHAIKSLSEVPRRSGASMVERRRASDSRFAAAAAAAIATRRMRVMAQRSKLGLRPPGSAGGSRSPGPLRSPSLSKRSPGGTRRSSASSSGGGAKRSPLPSRKPDTGSDGSSEGSTVVSEPM